MLPTLLTLGNAACGFGAISFASGWTGYDTATSMFAAGALIYLAMLFDALDGTTARWANQQSEFGAQLDSLCDAISFGAAPAFLMLVMSQPAGFHRRALWVVAALYVVCTVLRLARFNVESDEEHKPGFSGLPSPAAAAVVASFPITLFGPQLFSGVEPTPDRVDEWAARLVPFVTFGVACLMVSRVRYVHMFQQLVRGRRSRTYLIKLVFALAVVVTVPRVAVPILACYYAFAAPALALWHRYLKGFVFGPPGPPAPPPTDDPRWTRNPPGPPGGGNGNPGGR